MPDDENGRCFVAFRPAYGCEQVGGVAIGAESFVGFKRQAERFRRLLAANGGADQDAQALRRVFLQPFGHLRGLLLAAGGEFAFEVGEAVFGFGVAPE